MPDEIRPTATGDRRPPAPAPADGAPAGGAPAPGGEDEAPATPAPAPGRPAEPVGAEPVGAETAGAETAVAETVANDEAVADEAVPGQVMPDGTEPDEVVPSRVAPDGTASEQALPDGTGPDEVVPSRSAPDGSGPEQALPDRVTPGRTAPDPAVPAEPAPAEPDPSAPGDQTDGPGSDEVVEQPGADGDAQAQPDRNPATVTEAGVADDAEATDMPAQDAVPEADVPGQHAPGADLSAQAVPATDVPAQDAPGTDVPVQDQAVPGTVAPEAGAPVSDGEGEEGVAAAVEVPGTASADDLGPQSSPAAAAAPDPGTPVVPVAPQEPDGEAAPAPVVEPRTPVVPPEPQIREHGLPGQPEEPEPGAGPVPGGGPGYPSAPARDVLEDEDWSPPESLDDVGSPIWEEVGRLVRPVRPEGQDNPAVVDFLDLGRRDRPDTPAAEPPVTSTPWGSAPAGSFDQDVTPGRDREEGRPPASWSGAEERAGVGPRTGLDDALVGEQPAWGPGTDAPAGTTAATVPPASSAGSGHGPSTGDLTPRGRLLQAMRPRANRGQLLAMLLCFVLGLAGFLAVRQNQNLGLASMRQSDLVSLLDNVTERSTRLEEETRKLQAVADQLRSGSDKSAAALTAARQRLEVLGILAGTVPATGPGIQLAITDPKHLVTAAIVLDTVQELRDAGAEAIQIGSVRVTASTFFVDSTAGIRIDGTEVAPPYQIEVIGDPQTLSSALGIPGGVLEVLRQQGATGHVTMQQSVTVSALRAVSAPQYARPATSTAP